MDVRVGLWRRLSTKELTLSNCGAGEDSRVPWRSNQSILKAIKPVNAKGNQPWIFIGRTDVEAEAPILGPPDVKSWLIRKNPDARKDWRQEEHGWTEDKMVQWHHWLNGHEFGQAPRDGERHGSLICYIPCGCKESDITEQLNKNNRSIFIIVHRKHSLK